MIGRARRSSIPSFRPPPCAAGDWPPGFLPTASRCASFVDRLVRLEGWREGGRQPRPISMFSYPALPPVVVRSKGITAAVTVCEYKQQAS